MNDLLKQSVDNAPDAILISDKEGKILYWNRGAELIFGHTEEEALGRTLDLIIPDNLRSRHWEGYHRVMASGETKYKTGLLSSPGIRKDGSRISLEFSMVLVRNETGELAGCTAIMRDITERWNREKDLREKLIQCEKMSASH